MIEVDPYPEVESEWAAEIGRRVTAIDAGQMSLESWASVRRRIVKELRER